MNDKLIIIGAGGHGKVVADIAREMNKWKIIQFLDDNYQTNSEGSIDVVGTINDIELYKQEADFLLQLAVIRPEKRFNKN